jgi:hypothetical protein
VNTTIKIIVIVVCFVAAAGIYWWNRSRSGPGGIESIPAGDLIWVKCNNPNCKAEYQMEKRAYHQQMEEKLQGKVALQAPPLVCKQCGKESLYRAVKCEKCGLVFFYESVPNDFADRCPECGYSKKEEQRKEAAARRQRQ